MIDSVAAVALNNVTVDRGHSHSNGLQEVSIWISDPPDARRTLCPATAPRVVEQNIGTAIASLPIAAAATSSCCQVTQVVTPLSPGAADAVSSGCYVSTDEDDPDALNDAAWLCQVFAYLPQLVEAPAPTDVEEPR